jgi:outer membrane receptor protein involved in Fe transport
VTGPLAVLLLAALAQEVTISVRVGDRPVPGAAILVESGAMRYEARTGDDGQATIALRTPGRYRATHDGDTREFDVARDGKARVEFTLTRRDSVTVEERAEAVAATREQVRSLPERVADVRGALPLIPGVVRTPEGKLQIAASPEYRSTFRVNSIDVTDPATGGFGATVPIDVVESVQVYKSPFLAEYGRFSAAVVAITTRRGGDQWHKELNDPTPEFRIRSGHLVGIRGFTPRFAATGPLLAGKLYFAGAGSFELRKRPVYPLPFPYNEEKSQRVNAYAQLDYIPRAGHLVTLSAHGVPQRVSFANLNFYTPQTAAASSRSHEYRATLSDRLETRRGILESSLSVAEVRGRIWGQGNEPPDFTPTTTLGNYFMTRDRRARRAQWVEAWSRTIGRHSVKLGGSLARATLEGAGFAREVLVDGRPALPPRLEPPQRLTDWETGLYAQDGWEPIRSLRFDAGVRIDRQRLTGVTNVAPRLGAAWSPGESARTVVRGGIGWFYDRVPLSVLPGRFSPRSRTWSAGVDRRIRKAILLHAGYLHSDHSHLIVANPALSGNGRAATRELELTAKFSWYEEQQWIVSYTHTRGRGNLSTFDRFLGDYPERFLRPDARAMLPGVIPHRFLTWGVFPLRYGLRFAPVVEWRNGFPYSALDARQQYAETPNARRLPPFFSLDARVSKDIARRGHKVRLAFSMFNVTDHANFDAVRLNVADPQFGETLGRRPRRFRVDFDWLF